jgi:hypothetical protein
MRIKFDRYKFQLKNNKEKANNNYKNKDQN